jgi:hypothetical protein
MMASEAALSVRAAKVAAAERFMGIPPSSSAFPLRSSII